MRQREREKRGDGWDIAASLSFLFSFFCLFFPYRLFFRSLQHGSMPKMPKQPRTSRGARVDPSLTKDFPGVSAANTFMSTAMNDDTEMQVDPTPTTSLKRKGRDSKKSKRVLVCLVVEFGVFPDSECGFDVFLSFAHVSLVCLVIALQKQSASRAEGQRPKAKQQKVVHKNRTSTNTTTDSKKVTKDIAELSKNLQARFFVSDEPM